MASRTLLCVEPDERAVTQFRLGLEPYGIAVQNIPNGEAAVDWARANDPVLIIVSVEPRKVGYAVCNKLKRSAELAHIPLILTSAEETPQTFEQHKKLKSRADEYLLKPFRDEDFLSKVAALIELRSPGQGGRPANGTGPEHPLLGAEISEELSVGDSDIVEEDVTSDILHPPSSPFDIRRGGIDQAFERETDAAFAALEASGGEAAQGGASREDGVLSMWEEEKTRATMVESELPDVDVEETGTPFLGMFQRHTDEATPFPPGPDEVQITPSPATVSRDDQGLDLSARLAALENERQALQEEVEVLRRRTEGPPPALSKDREYLSLRETINRKEKDLLDLRDAIDAKDRQLLDQKDSYRELERARRDLDAKMLELEKNFIAMEERSTALAHDKDKALERERALRSNLEEIEIELHRSREQVEVLDKKLRDTEVSRGDLEQSKLLQDERVAQAEERHRAEVNRLLGERGQAEQALRIELEELQERSRDEAHALTARLEAELLEARKSQEQALLATRADLSAQLDRERQTHLEAMEGKESSHADELQSLRRHLEEERAEAERRRGLELGEAEARRAAELESAEQRRLAELKGQREDYESRLAALDRTNQNEQGEAAERYQGEIERSVALARQAESDLAARAAELEQVRAQLQAVEGQRDRLAADLSERDTTLVQLRERSSALEAKSTEYEDQLLRAYQKLRSDDKLLDRAKRALAVSLQILDERVAAPAPGASSSPPAASPGATISTLPTPLVVEEDPGTGG